MKKQTEEEKIASLRLLNSVVKMMLDEALYGPVEPIKKDKKASKSLRRSK